MTIQIMFLTSIHMYSRLKPVDEAALHMKILPSHLHRDSEGQTLLQLKSASTLDLRLGRKNVYLMPFNVGNFHWVALVAEVFNVSHGLDLTLHE